jgi:carboxymethylenebutenolidase
MQLVRSFQVGELSRRDFLKRATVLLGSAATANLLLVACSNDPNPAAPPVLEETGAAETEAGEAMAGLVTSMVDYEDGDGEQLMGYLARPEGDEPAAAIVVIQEWWGLNDHIKEVAQRFAEQGYVALAPDLYHGQVATEPDEARKLVMELDMAAAVSEIQRAIDFLQGQTFVAGPKVGLVGFCMGGGLVLQTALAEEDLGAGVAFYGSPLSPDQAATVKAPIMGHFGRDDGGIPVEAVETMDAAFDEAGVENEIYIYDGAPHAFFNDTRDSYRPEAAADAWQRTLTWFGNHLGA